MHWSLDHLGKQYAIIGMTRDLLPTNLGGEGKQTLGHSRLTFDFGYPDMRSRGEIKSDYFMRMVAAAPDMLEALEEVVKIDNAINMDLIVYGNSYVPETWFKLRSLAIAAIAKAKGEQQ